MASVWPVLHYDDTRSALTFLVDALGFDEVIAVADNSGEIVHAEVRWQDGGCLVLGSTRHTDGVHGAMRAGTSAVYLVTQDVDAVHERMCDFGEGVVVQAPQMTQFGSGSNAYVFTAADPEGNLWTFGTYAGATG